MAGYGEAVGGQYTYDRINDTHSVSIGYGIFAIEKSGNSTFIGVDINFCAGIGIGGEAGVKWGIKF